MTLGTEQMAQNDSVIPAGSCSQIALEIACYKDIIKHSLLDIGRHHD